MKRVLLIRHAECHMNLELAHRVGGRSNHSPLTELGVQQARALGKHYLSRLSGHAEPGPCFTSTAVRAVETARIALTVMQRPEHPIQTSEQLLELSQGDWEGQVRSECYTPSTLATISANPWEFAAPGGESQRQVEERMLAYVLGTVLPEVQEGGPPAMVVTHGLAIKCFLRGLLGSTPALSRKIVTHNTSITEVALCSSLQGLVGSPKLFPLTLDPDHLDILRVNDITHLHLEGLVGQDPAS